MDQIDDQRAQQALRALNHKRFRHKVRFTRNQILGGLLILALIWLLILFRMLSSGA